MRAGDEYREDDSISLEKREEFIFLTLRINLVMRGDLEHDGTAREERTAK